MIIGIDGNEANVESKVGVSEFAFALLQEFSGQKSGHVFTIYLKDQPRPEFPNEREKWNYRVLTPKKLWTQWRLPLDLYIHRPKPDVFFSPSHYAPRFSPVSRVVSVMDLSYLYYPEMFRKDDLYQLVNWTKYSVKKAKAVITISKSSQNDIIEEYKLPKERVHVVYPGMKELVDLNPHIYAMNELHIKYKLKEKYILFVGTLQPRKNISKLIEAFSKVKKMKGNEDILLVIVGKKGWLYEEILTAPKTYKIEDSVRFLDYVTDEDLPLLYKNAQCFILPSLYEGFGLPVVEAMQYGCPVITSNVSSMPEAGGDAALYVDPNNADDIADKINTLLNDKSLRKELIERGKKQVSKFTWEKSAKEVLTILENVANER